MVQSDAGWDRPIPYPKGRCFAAHGPLQPGGSARSTVRAARRPGSIGAQKLRPQICSQGRGGDRATINVISDNHQTRKLYILHNSLSATQNTNYTSVDEQRAHSMKNLCITVPDTATDHVGDEAIQAVANICRSALRKTDCACRFGGDEFVVALPNTGHEQAMQFARRIHDLFREELSKFSVDGIAVTASMGVTTMIPEDRSYEDTIKRADQALYEAKHGGKNRIVSA